MNKGEIISEIAQMTFIVFGGLCLFFSGFVFPEQFTLSFILLILGTISVMIRVEYTKDEGVTE